MLHFEAGNPVFAPNEFVQAAGDFCFVIMIAYPIIENAEDRDKRIDTQL